MPGYEISVLVRATLFMRRVRPKLTPTERLSLLLIAEGKGRGVYAIAADAGINAGEASKAVMRLMQHGFVFMTPDTTDRRRKHLTLTPKGRGVAIRLVRAMRGELSSARRPGSPRARERRLPG